MSENHGSVRLICSLSLASCRLKAEALARLLHNKLWSSGVTSLGGIENNNGDCDRLIKENVLKTKSLHIIDQAPKSQIYGASDVNNHHWKHAMHTEEEEELYDTPDCSSPPSPADEDILVNPSVYVSLPNVCTLSSEQFLVHDRDPCTSRSVTSEKEECQTTCCKLGGITSKDRKILYEKLQRYASENCSSLDEGLETFYDVGGDEEDHFPHSKVEEDIALNFLDGKSGSIQTRNNECTLKDNGSPETDICLATSCQAKVIHELPDETGYDYSNKLLEDGSTNEQEQSDRELKNSSTLLDGDMVKTGKEEGHELTAILVESEKQRFLIPEAPNDQIRICETKIELTEINDHVDSHVEISGRVLDTAEREEACESHTQSSDQSVSLRNEPEAIQNRDLLKVVEEDDRPVLLRSTSLKTGKTPPGTPRRKKIVRFADALGLDLEAVRHIVMDDLPVVPPSAFMDLSIPESDQTVTGTSETSSDWNSTSNISPLPSQPSCQSHRTLCPLFQPPALCPDFLNRVQAQKVCVENVLVSDLVLHCVVRVLNIGFEKSVVARYTVNEWLTFDDAVASYVPGSSDGFSDKFSFNLFLPPMNDCQKLTFAVRYVTCGEEYWDNNNGENYSLRYHSNSAVMPSHESRPSWLHHFI